MKQQKEQPIAAATLRDWATFFAAAKITQARIDAERTVALGDELMRLTKQSES